MRLTNKLYAQHIGWMFKKNWQVQGKRIILDTGTAEELGKCGIQVKDIKEVLGGTQTRILQHNEIEIVGSKVKLTPEDETHLNWHKNACYTYSNSQVLLEGVHQAQLLSKTIEICSFPQNIEEAIKRLQFPQIVDQNVQQSIMSSHVYDAEQVKLPKVKLINRPHYNLPRIYGISFERRNKLLMNKLIAECERLAGRSVNSRRRFVDNANFKVTLTKDNDLLQFVVDAEKFMTAHRPIEAPKCSYDGEIPDLFPMKCTITMPKKHIYTTETFYPIEKIYKYSHPHTIFSTFNKEIVGNLHETEVTTSQLQGRTLLKAYTVAAARAKQLYGDAAVNQLPKPIIVQSIQTDGRTYHFGIFQLNTLSVDGIDGVKNYWFHQPNMELFQECGYKDGRPILEGYNKDVFRCLVAFYNNS